MRALLLAAPLLLAGCVASWPTGSYEADISDPDAAVLAPAIAHYVAATVHRREAVHVVPAQPKDTLAQPLTAALNRAAIRQAPDGRKLQYVADAWPGGGVLLRVSIDDREGASQYFTRVNNGLTPSGPMMVAVP